MHAQQSTSNQIPGTRKRFSIGDRNADGPSVLYSVFLCIEDGHLVTNDQGFSPVLGKYLFTTTGEGYDDVVAKILSGEESTLFQACFNHAHNGCAETVALGFQPIVFKVREYSDKEGKVVTLAVKNNISAIRIKADVIGERLSQSALFSLAGKMAGEYAAPMDCGQRFVGEMTFTMAYKQIEHTINEILENMVVDCTLNFERRTFVSNVMLDLKSRKDSWAMKEMVFQAAIAAFEATPKGAGWSGSLPLNSRALF